MNINQFSNVLNLSWQEVEGEVGAARMRYLLPYVKDKKDDDQNYPDLRGARIVNNCWVNDRVKPRSPGHWVWWGEIHQQDRLRPYLILLELTMPDKQIGKIDKTWFGWMAHTPPGRPGNPATLLIDGKGQIVPKLYWNATTQVRVFFLNHSFDDFGWNLIYPTIGLQFVEGVCTVPAWRLALWNVYLARNKA